MVKNTIGGNKAKKGKAYVKKSEIRTMIIDSEGELWGQINTNNGSHFTVFCSDGIIRIGKVRHKMCRRESRDIPLTRGSFVVVALRSFEMEQKHCDIMNHADPPEQIKLFFKNMNKQ